MRKIFIISTILLLLFGLTYYWNIFNPNEQVPSILSFEDFIKDTNKDLNCEYSEWIEYNYYKKTVWDKNNKFGLYIYAENRDYFEIAQKLINSNGGDWGYVLIPYNVGDRDTSKWSRVFEQLRNKHLIPIIQLWDVDTSNYEDQTDEAARFLGKFLWPIKERYVSVYNETNDAKFWYGNVNPEEYAKILDYTIKSFKNIDKDFFIMNGAFNVSAPTNESHLDSFEYMKRMNDSVPGIFERIDGWASHSYPQPNFSGDPTASGRWSIKAYEDELNYLEQQLGVEKNLPVFITETGWAHAEGQKYNDSYLSMADVASRFESAYKDVWLKDSRVRAVTPFTIKYESPYDHFSWINEDNVPYRQYNVIKSMDKIEGNPPHVEKGSIQIAGCHD